MTPSLEKNVAWAVLGNVAYAACQCAVLVAVARLGTPADVGRLALALALTAPVVILANLQLRAALATDAHREHAVATYVGLRLLTTAGALLAIGVLAVHLGHRGVTLAVIAAVALAKAFEAGSDVLFGLFQRAENLRQIALSMLARGTLSVLVVSAVLGLGGSLVAAVGAMALAWGLCLVAYDLPRAARLGSLRPAFVPAELARLAWVALPLGCVSALNSLTANLPRYAVEAHLGVAALGHFAALAYLLVAATQPVLALAAAATPRLALHFATDAAAYRSLVRRALAASALFGAALVVATTLAGRSLLAASYGAEYAAHAPLLLWLALATALSFVSATLGAAVTAARRFPPQLAVAALGCAVCAAASALLVPQHGLLGATLAVVAGEATRLACLVLLYGAISPRATLPLGTFAAQRAA